PPAVNTTSRPFPLVSHSLPDSPRGIGIPHKPIVHLDRTSPRVEVWPETTTMEHIPYRGRQSLDYGRGCWPQYSAEPEVEQGSSPAVAFFRGLGSSSWPSPRGGGGGDPRSSQQWRPGKDGIMTFTTPPTPSQVDMLNSYGGGGGQPPP